MIDVLITCGDVNGIGPEIALKTISYFEENDQMRFVFFAPSILLNEPFSAEHNFKVITSYDEIADNSGNLLFDIGQAELEYGVPTELSGRIAFDALSAALSYLNSNRISSLLVTAPIAKSALKLAGVDKPGHTEILAEYFNVDNYAMIFLSGKWHAALSTIHIPVKKVAEQLTTGKLKSLFDTVIKMCINDLKIDKPKIAVLGLNPHAGESGAIGNEEIEILLPAMSEYLDYLYGPFVPDAFFAEGLQLNYDVTIGMYHDQILIPFKMNNGKEGVNFTAGLPIVRTSPDHGTAFDIAGKGIADPQSTIQSVYWGVKILKNRMGKYAG